MMPETKIFIVKHISMFLYKSEKAELNHNQAPLHNQPILMTLWYYFVLWYFPQRHVFLFYTCYQFGDMKCFSFLLN